MWLPLWHLVDKGGFFFLRALVDKGSEAQDLKPIEYRVGFFLQLARASQLIRTAQASKSNNSRTTAWCASFTASDAHATLGGDSGGLPWATKRTCNTAAASSGVAERSLRIASSPWRTASARRACPAVARSATRRATSPQESLWRMAAQIG